MDSLGQFPDNEMNNQQYPEQTGMFITLPNEMEGFTLCSFLGGGSTGKVFKALQTKEYAVKVIYWRTNNTHEIAKHEYAVGKLFNSCDETLHSLNYYEQDHQSYIIMEYGVPCLSYYANRECSLRDILKTVLRMSKALEQIHAKGYSHFDVKPENIMMVRGEAKLADFSHCSQFLHEQKYNRPMGTGVYMAPEIMVGGEFTGKEDMYSLGISMYALLMAGRLPFDFSKRESQRRERYDTIDSLFIHPELLEIIQHAAAFDACDRYDEFEEFSSAILRFINTHNDRIDEEMPLYRINPTLQHTVSTLPSFTWNGPFCDNETKDSVSILPDSLS